MPLRFVLAFGLAGCALARSPIVSVDGALGSDGGDLDAPLADAGELDAPADAPADTGPPCTPAGAVESACDRIDEDCDGTIDDDDVCGCLAFTVLGRAYLRCEGPVDGMELWSGACRTAAPGYDLVVFSDGPERDGVAAALLALGVPSPHWIGLNDFDESGTYVWRDRSTAFTPISIGIDDPARRFVVMLADGSYEEAAAADEHAFVCEAEVAPGPCGAAGEAAACDGIDGDCDGSVDEAIDCGSRDCTSRTFWDHVYYVCTDTRNHGEARSDCTTGSGSMLASIGSDTERAFLTAAHPSEAWIGLTQATDAGATFAGWVWFDGSTGYGVPVTPGVLPWDVGEPNDGGDLTEDNQENCGLLLPPARQSALDDRGCGAHLPFLCERAWSY